MGEGSSENTLLAVFGLLPCEIRYVWGALTGL